MKRKLRSFAIVLIAISAIISSQNFFAQTQRNPVLEFCTGTWCQWCPCGDDIILESILPNIPNAIVLAYHGAGSDPFRIFPGSNIISLLGFSGYPTGTIDRKSGVLVWNQGWPTWVSNRNSVPATVSIEVERSYNVNTREFNATIDFTALENLSGQYSYNIILVEDGQVWGQTSNNTCTPGITFIADYVHYWLVRDMMNGATGQEVINGAWNQGQVVTKTFSYTVAVPPSPAPDFIPDSSAIVVMVYKNGAPLNSNAEIQQAGVWPLVSPDYVATINSQSPDIITANNSSAQFSATLYNEGLLNDTYDITATIDGPSGWTGEFTTVNGTFPFGTTDAVSVTAGESTTISVMVNPNSINGSGIITLEYASQNNGGVSGSITFSTVTNTGVHLLVVDATEDGYASLVSDALDGFYEGIYGVVSREALQEPSLDLSYFTMISWSGGNSLPAFYPDEVNNLQTYLDQGGNILMSGQNIGTDIFGAGGQSQFAQSFFNNYLHSNYLADFGGSYIVSGYPGDPITDGVQFTLNSVYTRSPDEISPIDANTSAIIQFLTGPKISSVKADDGNHRVVYFGFAFEQVNDVTIADSLIARSVRWLTDGIILNNPIEETVASDYRLEQNYPNPFNPTTQISYSIPAESQVSLIIYDVMGREVDNLVNGRQSAGNYEIEFDASALASGTYFYKLTAGEFVSVKKMSLLK